MKRLSALLLLAAVCLGAGAQTRSYSDNQSKTFIIGLDSYFYGTAGSLDFPSGGVEHKVSVQDGTVSVNGTQLDSGGEDTVVGIHDFTEDRQPELVVARRGNNAVLADVYTYADGKWKRIGQMQSPDAEEIRVFRQVVSIRRGEALCSWTWRGGRFNYKASDGSAEPTR